VQFVVLAVLTRVLRPEVTIALAQRHLPVFAVIVELAG